jgi:hypothetical protein
MAWLTAPAILFDHALEVTFLTEVHCPAILRGEAYARRLGSLLIFYCAKNNSKEGKFSLGY